MTPQHSRDVMWNVLQEVIEQKEASNDLGTEIWIKRQLDCNYASYARAVRNGDSQIINVGKHHIWMFALFLSFSRTLTRTNETTPTHAHSLAQLLSLSFNSHQHVHNHAFRHTHAHTPITTHSSMHNNTHFQLFLTKLAHYSSHSPIFLSTQNIKNWIKALFSLRELN